MARLGLPAGALGGEHHTLCGGVPALLVEGDGAALSQTLPEGLHEGLVARDAVFERGEELGVFVGREDRVHHVGGAGVHEVEEVADAAALAGSVPALEEHHQAQLLLAGLLLQEHELLHELVALLLVGGFLGRLFLEVYGFKHGVLLRLISPSIRQACGRGPATLGVA